MAKARVRALQSGAIGPDYSDQRIKFRHLWAESNDRQAFAVVGNMRLRQTTASLQYRVGFIEQDANSDFAGDRQVPQRANPLYGEQYFPTLRKKTASHQQTTPTCGFIHFVKEGEIVVRCLCDGAHRSSTSCSIVLLRVTGGKIIKRRPALPMIGIVKRV